MSAYEFYSFEKLGKLWYRSFVKRTSIAFDTANVKNFSALWLYFGINESNGVHFLINNINVQMD